MGLKEQQDLLARLYTDIELQEDFARGPDVVGERFGLKAGETRDLSAIAEGEIRWFSDSLYWKRLREVTKLMPVSSWYIGVEFGSLYREFSRGYRPASAKKHLEDAPMFAKWLATGRHLDPLAVDVIRFESARLRHGGEGRRLTTCHLKHDVRPLFDYGGPDAIHDVRRRRSIAVWVGTGRRTRMFFL